jgi:transcription elongation factor GreA
VKNTATGEIESFTFLGPWDTDIPKRIYSYQAPLSQAFMGKRMGETVTAPGEGGPRTFEILEIAPAI